MLANEVVRDVLKSPLVHRADVAFKLATTGELLAPWFPRDEFCRPLCLSGSLLGEGRGPDAFGGRRKRFFSNAEDSISAVRSGDAFCINLTDFVDVEQFSAGCAGGRHPLAQEYRLLARGLVDGLNCTIGEDRFRSDFADVDVSGHSI